MPPKHTETPPSPKSLIVGKQYMVRRDAGPAREFPPRSIIMVLIAFAGPATILDTRSSKHGAREAYISFVGEDKRLDAWVRETDVVVEVVNGVEAGPSNGFSTVLTTPKRRKRQDEVRSDDL